MGATKTCWPVRREREREGERETERQRDRERQRESASKFCKKDCFLIYQSVNRLSLCFGLCSKIKDRKHLLDLR